jgi:hypothetical protein
MDTGMKKQKEDLKLLRDLCLVYNNFRRMTNPLQHPLMVAAFDDADRKIHEAYDTDSKLPLELMKKELDDFIIYARPNEASQLLHLLKQELGLAYKVDRKKAQKKIAYIIKQGKISNRMEYELVNDRVEEIHGDATKASELEQLNQLLAGMETGIE